MREVFAATAVRKISGALMCEYSMREWCSTAQMPSKPTSSAYTACSTQLRIAWRSTSGVPYSTWASKIIENFMPGTYPCPPFARTCRGARCNCAASAGAR